MSNYLWLTTNLAKLSSSTQKALDAFEDYLNPEPLALAATQDLGYQAYQDSLNHWGRLLKSTHGLLKTFPLPPMALHKALCHRESTLLEQQRLTSPYDYQQGLRWLGRNLTGNPFRGHYQDVLAYHEKQLRQFLQNNPEAAIVYFHRDVISHLTRYDFQDVESDTLDRLFALYESALPVELFNNIKKLSDEALQQSEIPKSIAKKIAAAFERELQKRIETQPQEQSSTNWLQLLTNALQVGWEHPAQVFFTGLLTSGLAPAAAAQNVFQVNTDGVNDTQSAPTVTAFPNGLSVFAWESNHVMGTDFDIFAQAFDPDTMPFGAEFQLNNETAMDQRNPSITTFPDGTGVAAWESFANGVDWDVRARRFNITGPIGPEFQLSTNVTDNQRRPHVTSFPNGEFASTWEQFGVGGWSVRSRRFDLDDQPIGDEIEASSAQINPRNPVGASLSSGDTVLSWENNQQQEVDYSSSTNIGDMTDGGGLPASFNDDIDEGVTCSTQGTPASQSFVGKDWGPGVTMTLTGANTWGRNDAGYTNFDPLISLEIRGSNTAPGSASDGNVVATVLNNQPDASNAHPQSLLTGFDTSTPYRYHWLRISSATVDVLWAAEVEFFETIHGIFSSIYNATSVPVIPEFRVNNFTVTTQSDPAIASHGNNHTTAWTSEDEDGSGRGVYYQTFSGDTPTSPILRANTETANDQEQPSLATSTNGERTLIVWQSEGQDASGSSVHGQLVNAVTGAPIGNEFLVNEGLTDGNQTTPTVTALDDTRFLVGFGDPEGIFARVINTGLSATATNQTINYQVNMPVNLADIIVMPTTISDQVTVRLTLSDNTAGTLPTDTVGTTTSTYNSGSGIWEAIGPVDDVNALLMALEYRPNFDVTNSLTIDVHIQDGLNNILSDTISVMNIVVTTATTATTATTGTTGASSTFASTNSGGSGSAPVTTTTSGGSTPPTSERDGSSDEENTSSNAQGNGSPTAIIGGVLGAVVGTAALCFLAVAAFLYFKNRKTDTELELNNYDTLPSAQEDAITSSTPPPRQISSATHTLASKISSGRIQVGGKYEIVDKATEDEAAILKEKEDVIVNIPRNKKAVKVTLGVGGFGKIMVAKNLETGAFVAAKRIKGEKAIEASQTEIEIQKKLHQRGMPHILPIYDSLEGTERGRHILYQFMPIASFGSGVTITEIVRRLRINEHTGLIEQLLGHLARQIAYSLAGIHNEGYSHLDFKPANFVIDKKGEAYVIDFGCAVELGKNPAPLRHTQKGDCRYFSPERTAESIEHEKIPSKERTPYSTAANDWWALGITLLEMTTGENPFITRLPAAPEKQKPEETYRIVCNHYQNKLDAISELEDPDSDSLFHLIRGLLQVNPKERFTKKDVFNHPSLKKLEQKEREKLFKDIKLTEHASNAFETSKPLTSEERDKYYGKATDNSNNPVDILTSTPIGLYGPSPASLYGNGRASSSSLSDSSEEGSAMVTTVGYYQSVN